MTEERRKKLLNNFVGWFMDHQTSDEGLFRDLHVEIGMTKEEIESYGIDIAEQFNTVQKEQEKVKEETIKTLIAEDVVEQTVYALNTPKGVTEGEQAKNMLGMIGANIMDESIYGEPDYEKEVEKSIVKEFADFKRERTEGETAGEVFDDAYEIHVKTQLKNAVGEEYFTPEIYKALYQKKGGILQALYDAYQQDPHASVTTNTDAQEFVEKYCDQNFPKIMNGDELAPTMGG